MIQTVRTPKHNAILFNEVDKVSKQIFNNLFSIEQPDVRSPQQTSRPRIQLLKIEFSDPSTPCENDLPIGWLVILEADGALSFASSKDCIEIGQIKRQMCLNARERFSAVPVGVEFLESEPQVYSEIATMAAVKVIMTAQRREFNLSNLPELAPPVAYEYGSSSFNEENVRSSRSSIKQMALPFVTRLLPRSMLGVSG